MKNLIISNNLSGIWTFPILINNHPDKKYYGFAIASIAGKILNLDQRNNYGEDEIKFDINTWDGSDFFSLDETLIVACTSKVADLLTKNKFTNLEIKTF